MKAIFFLNIIILTACHHAEKVRNSTDTMGFEVINNAFVNIVDTAYGIDILATGHDWTEGPLWVDDHDMLLYNDIPRNTTYSWSESEGVQEYLKPSGFTGGNFTGAEPGANGMILNGDNRLILCQHGDRRLAYMNSPLDTPKSDFVTITANYEGLRYNSPNDVIIDSQGDLYFSDPPYGLPKGIQDPEKEIPFQGVFRYRVDGDVQLITNGMTRPNGLAISPDETTLYIANSDPEKALWMTFGLSENGTVSDSSLFYDATELVPDHKGLPDGLKVNKNGVIFASGPGGVFVFKPDATLLGMISTGQATSNCALNGDESQLFITADMYVLRVHLK